MNLDNINEKRKVTKGKHSMTLEISKEEFNRSYGVYDNLAAKQIVNQHLQRNNDDGRARNINIEKPDQNNIVRISADIDYTDNDHTGYSIH